MTVPQDLCSSAADRPTLEGLRVLDLSDQRGYLCGRTLAQLGADVIKIEPPDGDPGRRTLAPLNASGSSILWWAQNANKRSVTLDVRKTAGRDSLLGLLDGADVFIESCTPGELDSLGLGYEALRNRFPKLIYTSISPFGHHGPDAGDAATDLTIQALGGHMYVTGDADRAPVRVGLPVSALHAGVEAAAATLVAVYERQTSGIGQHVDVSMQECLVWTLLNTTMTWDLTGRNEMRGGAVRRERSNPILTRLIWRCADGLVHFVPVAGGGGRSRIKSWETLVAWMESEGFGAPILRAREWNGDDQYSISQDEYDEIASCIQAFLLQHSVAELYERAVTDGLLLAPVSTVPDIVESRQLRDRAFFETVAAPGLADGAVTVPGPFARFSLSRAVPARPAPSVGADNAAVLEALETADTGIASDVAEGAA